MQTMRLAYFDCFSGISGDMTLGAMAALGVPMDWLEGKLTALPLTDFKIVSRGIVRHGIQATKIDVHAHETHHHRNYTVIQELIRKSDLSEWVKAKSLAVFDRIAVAEAAIHGVPKEKVHFHEVGSVDAIVDIVGACLCFEYLEIKKVIASPLPLGKGFVQCEHGTLPVPAPATLEIVKGIPVYAGDVQKEMVTPTGAAIMAEFASSFEDLPVMKVDGIGYGAGTRELEHQPNLLRVLIGQSGIHDKNSVIEKLTVVECNIDDMNPEWFGYLMGKLFEDGAMDVIWVPIYMKKNRPGTMIQVLCNLDVRDRMITRMMSETTTLGVRFYEVHRKSLLRQDIHIDTQWGKMRAKMVGGVDGTQRIVPEFDDCARVAKEYGIALRVVYDAVLMSGRKIQTEETR